MYLFFSIGVTGMEFYCEMKSRLQFEYNESFSLQSQDKQFEISILYR